MKQTLLLLKTIARVRLRGMGARGKTKAGTWALRGAMVFGAGSLLAYLALILGFLQAAATPLGMAELPLALGLMVAFAIIFVMAFLQINGEIFSSRDAPFLYSLPITYRQIFLAKLLWVWACAALPGMCVGVVAMGVYAGFVGVSVGFVLKGLLVLLLPALPVALGVAPALVLALLLRRVKRRDTVMMAFYMALAMGFVALQSLMGPAMGALADAAQAEALIAQTLAPIARQLPPVAWAAQAVCQNGTQALFLLLWFALVSVAAAGAVVLLGIAFFPRHAWASAESSARGRKARGRVGVKNPVVAMALKEWRTMVRSPTYALNGMGQFVLVPIVLIMPSLVGNQEMDLTALMAEFSARPWFWLIPAALLAFLLTIQPAAATTFSREGANVWRLRSLPVAVDTLVLGKWLCHAAIAMAGTGVIALMMGLAYGFSWRELLPAATLVMAMGTAGTWVSMACDFLHPKLTWDTETEAIKQNMNTLVAMGLCLLLLLLLAGAAVPMALAGWPKAVIWAVCTAGTLGLSAGLYRVVVRLAKRQFPLEP